jgi:hypothetical protein
LHLQARKTPDRPTAALPARNGEVYQPQAAAAAAAAAVFGSRRCRKLPLLSRSKRCGIARSERCWPSSACVRVGLSWSGDTPEPGLRLCARPGRCAWLLCQATILRDDQSKARVLGHGTVAHGAPRVWMFRGCRCDVPWSYKSATPRSWSWSETRLASGRKTCRSFGVAFERFVEYFVLSFRRSVKNSAVWTSQKKSS